MCICEICSANKVLCIKAQSVNNLTLGAFFDSKPADFVGIVIKFVRPCEKNQKIL